MGALNLILFSIITIFDKYKFTYKPKVEFPSYNHEVLAITDDDLKE